MKRRSLRKHIFKIIFRLEFNEDIEEQIQLYVKELNSADEQDIEYITRQVKGIIEQIQHLDQLINKNAKKWTTNRMSKVDLSLLRLALYEIYYDEDIPTNVALNEAIELAKLYGGANSSSFINGVISKIIN